MGRAIAAVIVGYITLAIVLSAGLMGAYFVMGTERSFRPGTFDPSILWLVIMFAVGFVATLLGGVVCRAIARRPRPVIVLACILLAYTVVEGGVRMANPGPDPGPRPAELSGMKAARQARTPAWVSFSNGALGFLGVVIGGRAFGRPTAPTPL